VSLDFEDYPFDPSKAPHPCALCGAEDSYLDEVITDDAGGRMFVCSDTDYCRGADAACAIFGMGAPQLAIAADFWERGAA
jgi:alpha-D-ribose 1-methylphosphonate 5-phosphate C-P lyase